MNFANIYRENLSKLIEDETKKIYTEDQENNVFGLRRMHFVCAYDQIMTQNLQKFLLYGKIRL